VKKKKEKKEKRSGVIYRILNERSRSNKKLKKKKG
jgi:hypothetical protein